MRTFYTTTRDRSILGRDGWMSCKDRVLSMYVPPRDEVAERTLRSAKKYPGEYGERPTIQARVDATNFEIVNIAGYMAYDYQDPMQVNAAAIAGVWGRKPLPAAYSRHAETPAEVAANVVASRNVWRKQGMVNNPPF
jgi:hypothetical protein